jgi:hypothetical protein
MLKTVSSITNAIGALNYKGTWNATTNTPTLVSSVGVKGDYYQVSVAGSTNINGISNWGVGDVIAFNGVVWQRIEGGADLNGVNLLVSGTTTLSGLTASTALALDASKDVISVTNTGTGNNVLGTSPTIATPTLTGDVQMSTGNLVVGTAGKGIDFSANSHTAGMTSELLDWYEEGTWTPIFSTTGTNYTSVTYITQTGRYTRIGDVVYIRGSLYTSAATIGSASGDILIGGFPFTIGATGLATIAVSQSFNFATNQPFAGQFRGTTTTARLYYRATANGNSATMGAAELGTAVNNNAIDFSGFYYVG